MRARGYGLATAVAVVTAASLSACANLESFALGDLPVPADSPIAVAAREAVRNPGPWPRFADIPRVGSDAPDPAGQAAVSKSLITQVDQMRSMAEAFPAPDPATVEAYASQAREAASTPVPPETSAAEIEAFARQLRSRATPPPPPS